MLVLGGHPWIFRNKFTRYEKSLKDGDWILLIGAGNKELGVGIYAKTGLIAVRIIYFGENFSLEILQQKIQKRMEKRIPLLSQTDSIRWIHGENDSLPGVTIDGHGNCLVIMCYAKSLESFARYIGRYLFYLFKKDNRIKLKPETILQSVPKRTGFETKEAVPRILRGIKTDWVKINYRSISYWIDPFGQKSGIYNDIRNLRDYILNHKEYFASKKILNLFSSNGLLSICLERAEAKEIISIDASRKAILVQEWNLRKEKDLKLLTESETKIGNHRIIKLDIFKNLKETLEKEKTIYDVIIIDPPNLTASEKDKETARKIYKKLIKETIPNLANKGTLILCSCSNRIHPNDFERICKEAISESGRKVKNPIRLKNEIDHPILDTFPEGNYFKAHIYHDLSSL